MILETSDVSLVERYYVYILQSLRDKGLYIGFSTNLKNRFQQHAKNRVKSTRLRTPIRLIHYEYFIDKADAKARERYLKSGYGRDQIKSFLKRTLYDPS